MNSVEIKNLCKNYRDFSLKNVSFTIPEGCVVGFIGENGAGKTTTINCILGAIRPDAGEVKVFGKHTDLLLNEERARIGVVMGAEGLPGNLTVKQVERVMAGVFNGWNGETFFRYTDKFSLSSEKKVKELSAGMKQKLALAVALSHGATLLVLDEPTTGLDPVAREEILEEFYDFIQNEKHSVLISSHIMGDLEKICDYIAFIHAGKIVFFEEKDALYEQYGLLKCDRLLLNDFDPSAVVGYTSSPYGASALVRKDLLPSGFVTERAEIEDIMLYFIKGKKL